MSIVNWMEAPTDAQAWGPETHKFMAGWYRTCVLGQWYFAQSKSSGWGRIDRPSTYRRAQMERRPK